MARIPSELKLRGRTGKYIFKKALEPLLPTGVLYRRKQGFAAPLDRWFRGELRELAYESIFSLDDGILDTGFLKKIWNQHQEARHDRSAHLWSVLIYCRWRERFDPG